MKGKIRFKVVDESTRKETELQSGDTLCIMRSNGTVGLLRQGTRLLGGTGDDKILADGKKS